MEDVEEYTGGVRLGEDGGGEYGGVDLHKYDLMADGVDGGDCVGETVRVIEEVGERLYRTRR
jgi:hypothetical protein